GGGASILRARARHHPRAVVRPFAGSRHAGGALSLRARALVPARAAGQGRAGEAAPEPAPAAGRDDEPELLDPMVRDRSHPAGELGRARLVETPRPSATPRAAAARAARLTPP